MTPDQVAEWLTYHKSLHPDFAAWANEHGTPEMRQAWIEILEPVDLPAAKSVSRMILKGTIQPLPGWEFNREWQMLATFVRRHAYRSPEAVSDRIRESRRQWEEDREEARESGIDAGSMYREILAINAQHPPGPAREAALDELWAPHGGRPT